MSEFRLTLKHPFGFFAAGSQMVAELARATGHSTRSLTSYLEELRHSEVALVYRAANQHELGRIEIQE